MRAPVFAVLLLSACSPESLAALTPPETNGTLTELSHDVTVRFEGNTARLLVARRFRNELDRYQSATHQLSVPESAIATSLRLGTNGRWQRAPRLSTIEELGDRWAALTSPGDADPVTVGRLEWSPSDQLSLELFAVAPGAEIDVEYELELPRDYAAGELTFEYPRDGVQPVFHLSQTTDTTVASVTVDGETLEEIGFRLTQRWSPRAPTDVRWATFPLGADRHALRLELDVAARLSPTPRRPNVVFLIDASHSQGPEGIGNQLALVLPFLANAPDAQVELIVYRRYAERLFGRFVEASDVTGLLAALPPEKLAPGNGSNVDEATTMAAELLHGRGGPGRLVLLTDGELRTELTDTRVKETLSTLPPEVVVHVVGRSRSEYGELELARDSTGELASVAVAHHGIAAAVNGTPGDPVEAARVMLGLLRPVQLDDVVVSTNGEVFDLVDVPSTLEEGASLRLDLFRAAAPSEVVVRGLLWDELWEQTVEVDRRLEDRMPSLLVGRETFRSELTDDELRTAAFAANAVSPVTGFLSMPDEAAPSYLGTLGGTGVASLCGAWSGSHCGGFTTCRMGLRAARPDFRGLLRELLGGAVEQCRATHGTLPVKLSLEATRDEVVDVAVSAPTAGLRECVTEAAWAMRLTAEFDVHAKWDVEL